MRSILFGVLLLAASQQWIDRFPVSEKTLVTTGENRYCNLTPGYRLTLSGMEGGRRVDLVITVLDEIVPIGGIDTRVVEERETAAGVLREVSRNFFALDPATKDVYYFGEDVDTYKQGRVANHEGSWRHGEKAAHFGLMMPGDPLVRRAYYQELAPNVAMDRAEVLSVDERIVTPAGTFEHCLRTRESTPLEHGSETKIYAPGIGIVQDGALKLVSFSR